MGWIGGGSPMSELWRKMPKMVDAPPYPPPPCDRWHLDSGAVGVLKAPLFAGK